MLRAIFMPIVILILAELIFHMLSKIPEANILESMPPWTSVLMVGFILLPSFFAYGLVGWNVLQRRLGGLGFAALAGLIVLLIETFLRIGADIMFQTFDLPNSFVGVLQPFVDLTTHLSVNQMVALGVLVGQLIMAPLYLCMSVLGGVAVKIMWRNPTGTKRMASAKWDSK